LLDLASAMKASPDHWEDELRGDAIACIFEKPSTRTRVSFAAAIARLGATPITLSTQELQLGRGESIADTARSLSLYVDALAVRTFAQATVEGRKRNVEVFQLRLDGGVVSDFEMMQVTAE